MKKSSFFFLFLVFFLIGVLITAGYGLIATRTDSPIKNIINIPALSGFSIENAPSQSIRGNILSMSGEVRWQSRVATEAAEITSSVILQQGEQIATGETGQVKIEFPGACLINIGSGAQIDFVQSLPVDLVMLQASGSANFVKTGDVPVTVRALHVLIKQNAGEMGVGVDQDNSLVNINIIRGSITVAFNDLQNVTKVLNFEANRRVSFNDLTRSFE